MLIDTFSNRLKKALDFNDMKQVDLVEKSKLDKSLISNYLSGKYKAKQDKLSLLSSILHVSETWLMGYDVPSGNLLYDNNIDTARFKELKNEVILESKGIRIPVLGVIPAGIPIEAIEEILDYEEIPQSWLKGNKEYFALRINGDSMSPTYETRRYSYF